MILFILLSIICLAVGVPCLIKWLANGYGETGYGEGFGWCLFLFILFMLFAVGISIDCSITHKNNYNKLTMLESNRKIYENKYVAIGNEFKSELSKYPIHEKEVFNKITPEKISLYFVKYPELRSVESIILLSKELASLQSKIYDADLEYNNTVLTIKKYQENKWWYGFWLNTYDVKFK